MHESAITVDAARRLQDAIGDITRSAKAWRIWFAMGNADVRMRYKRTVLGPFWITLSLAVQVMAIGIVFSQFLGHPMYGYVPYVALGLLVWQLLLSLANEAARSFEYSRSLIRNLPMPVGVHVMRTIWRNIVMSAHHCLFILAIAPFTAIALQPVALLAIPGVLLDLLNFVWMAFAVALISIRFRDVPPMLTSALQVVFFLTPIIWTGERLGDLLWLVRLNPVFHMIEVVRSPLLGVAPPIESYAFVALTGVIGCLATLWAYGRYHWRIAYWV